VLLSNPSFFVEKKRKENALAPLTDRIMGEDF
jgi:hypothetical protein